MAIGLKKPQKNVTVEHQRLLALVNSMTDGFLAVNENTEIVLSNSTAYSLLDSNTLEGKVLPMVLRLIDKRGKPVNIAHILYEEKPFTSDEWRMTYNDGSEINVFLSISPVRAGFGDKVSGGWVVILRDITVEKKIEQERDEFVSVASHELRTPVAIAEGSISNAILLSERSGASDTIKHSLAAAHDQIIFLSNLINDLSMLSKAERGTVGMEIDSFSPAALASSLAEDYQRLANVKHLTIRSQADNMPQIRSSSLYVREILQNFVTNAIKYTEKGSITISAKPRDGGVEFSVTDTGIGISKSEQAKIFEKFFRSSDWRVREVNGTGLGLYVSAKLAKALGASISIASEAEKGSTFSLFVPNMPETEAPK